jgi:hypothetical protein
LTTHEILSPLALIAITAGPHLGAIAVLLILAPTAGVAIFIISVKCALTVTSIITEHALVVVSICPAKGASTILCAVAPLA